MHTNWSDTSINKKKFNLVFWPNSAEDRKPTHGIS